MSIFRKEVFAVKKRKYYGDIDIDLLDVNDKIIEYEDVQISDFALMFTNIPTGILTKTQVNKYAVGIITDLNCTSIDINVSHCTIIAPVLKFQKPLKEIFKNTHKDEKGRDIVYFSKYPIEAISEEKKENIAISRKENKQKIHYFSEVINSYNLFNYPVISSNNEEYIKAISLTTASRYSLRNLQTVGFHNEYYIKLKPIKWLCDYENNRLICLDGLISGIPYNDKNEEIDFNKSLVYEFLKYYLLPDLMQFVEVPKLEEIKNVEVKSEEAKTEDIEIKDNVLNMLRELLNQTEAIKDENDKILIAEDIRVLASMYGRELIKIKNKEKSIYGSSERELIRNGILPYCDYIEREIKREEREDNKEKENKEIEMVINKLIERASLINDDEVKREILLQIEELKQDYLSELFKSKRPYQRIDFNKPLEKRKYSNGYEAMEYTVTLTLKPTRPVLIKELVEKELIISKRIEMEIENNELRDDLGKFDDYVTSIVKR